MNHVYELANFVMGYLVALALWDLLLRPVALAHPVAAIVVIAMVLTALLLTVLLRHAQEHL